MLRVITHLTSGVAGAHIAHCIALSATPARLPGDTRPCLAALLMFLDSQTKLVQARASVVQGTQHDEREGGPEASLSPATATADYFSYGLCLEALRNLMAMAAIPYGEMFALVTNIITTLQRCDDMRVLCAATTVLATMLAVLTDTDTAVLSCREPTEDTAEEDDEGEEWYGHSHSHSHSSSRPLYLYTSEERMHIVHHICTQVSSDAQIMASLVHIFQFFVFNQPPPSSAPSASLSSSPLIASNMNNRDPSDPSRSSHKDAAGAGAVPLVPSASSCDPAMWLLGNEFGMRTAGTAQHSAAQHRGLFHPCFSSFLCI